MGKPRKRFVLGIVVNYNLESERLRLREVTWNDVETIHALHSIPEVDEFNTLGIPKDIEETRAILSPLIEDQQLPVRKRYYWVIFNKRDDTCIGIVGMNLSADRFNLAEIYYKLFPREWGKGYATEVAKTLITFGFETLHLHRIEAGVATGNVQSIRVLEKIGMTREGVGRKILPIRGAWKDNYRYAILEDDPRDY